MGRSGDWGRISGRISNFEDENEDEDENKMPAVSNRPLAEQYSGQDLPLVFETMRNFAGGVDAFDDPIDLAQNQGQSLINVIIRDKLKARTRPGADPLGAATLVNPGQPVRGLRFFSTPALSQLLAVSGAKFFVWNGINWNVNNGWVPNNAAVAVAMAQGVDKMLVSDGVGNLQSFDGAAFTDLGNGVNSPPVGVTVLCWHTSRMFASGQAQNNDTIYVSNLLNFSNGNWNNTTRSFRVGGGQGDPIVGLASMPFFNLVVLKQNSVWMTLTDPTQDPASWSASQASDLLADGLGLVGKYAWCRYGNDILFFSQDGIRSVQRMIAASQNGTLVTGTSQFQLAAPISVPIQPIIDQINPNAMSGIVAVKYKEFAFFAVPLGANQLTNNAVLVWNGRLGCWSGYWQPWTPACWEVSRFNGIQQLVFGDQAGLVNFWKELNDPIADATYEDNGASYQTLYATRSFTFGDLESPKSGFNAKMRFNMGNAELMFTAVGDDAELNSFSQAIQPSGDILGVGTLPFLLQSQKPSLLPFSLRGLPSFNELYLQIQSNTGWWELRNLTAGARVRPLKRK